MSTNPRTNLRGIAIAAAACVCVSSLDAVAATPSVSANASSQANTSKASGAPVVAPSSGLTAQDLDVAIARLGDGNLALRRAAVQVIATMPADAIAPLEARMMKPEAGAGPMWLVLDKARKSLGDKTTPDAAEFEPALAAAIVDAGNTPAHRSLALLVAGMEACEREGGVVGARVLVRLAVENKGLLKAVASAALKRLGDHSVAALIEVRRSNDKELRTFANKTLDSLGKFLPSDAVQVRDPQALADVLIAFGTIKDPDAIRVIVGYLDADRAQVRDAARWSIGELGNDARVPLKEAFDAFTGERAGDDWPASRTLKALLEAYDKVRLAEVFKLLDEGTARRDAGDLEGAITRYDALLARAPTFERRGELAPAYLDLAHRREANDRPAARVLLAKALRLAAGTPLAATIESELDYLDGLDAFERGVADPTPLHRALALDSANAPARDLLQKLENQAQSRDDRLRRWAASAAAGLLAVLAAILFLGHKRATPVARRRPARV